jgi:hypothetical protein
VSLIVAKETQEQNKLQINKTSNKKQNEKNATLTTFFTPASVQSNDGSLVAKQTQQETNPNTNTINKRKNTTLTILLSSCFSSVKRRVSSSPNKRMSLPPFCVWYMPFPLRL